MRHDTTYDAARASLESEGGYLFPCTRRYFVSSPEKVRGLDT